MVNNIEYIAAYYRHTDNTLQVRCVCDA